MSRNHILFYFFGILHCFFIKIVAGDEAIVGGDLAPYDYFKYQVTILLGGHPPNCGGGILKELFIVTAAHCVIEPDRHLYALRSRDISVIAGTVDLNVPGVVAKVEKVYVPLEYTPQDSSIFADIAVLQLKEPLDIKKQDLRELRLPGNSRPTYASKIGKIAGIGWHTVEETMLLRGHHMNHNLRFAHTVVLNNTDCQHYHPSQNVTEKNLCARVVPLGHASHPSGVCIGDDGGPLVYKLNTVIGILTKSAVGCLETHSSGIYVRTSHHRAFLFRAMNKTSTWAMRVLDVST